MFMYKCNGVLASLYCMSVNLSVCLCIVCVLCVCLYVRVCCVCAIIVCMYVCVVCVCIQYLVFRVLAL